MAEPSPYWNRFLGFLIVYKYELLQAGTTTLFAVTIRQQAKKAESSEESIPGNESGIE
jgi:hypothetical protein